MSCRWPRKKSRLSILNSSQFWSSCRLMSKSSKRMPFTMRRIRWSRWGWCKYKKINKLPPVELYLRSKKHWRPLGSNRIFRWNKWKWWWRIRAWCKEWWIKWRARVKCRWWWRHFANNVALKMNSSSKQVSRKSNYSILSSNLSLKMIQNSRRLPKRCKWKLWHSLSKLKEAWEEWIKWECSDTINQIYPW